MTQKELDAIKALANAATYGPWEYDSSSDNIQTSDYQYTIGHVRGYGGNTDMESNAQFIASARTDIPALVAEIERLRKELANRPSGLCLNEKDEYGDG